MTPLFRIFIREAFIIYCMHRTISTKVFRKLVPLKIWSYFPFHLEKIEKKTMTQNLKTPIHTISLIALSDGFVYVVIFSLISTRLSSLRNNLIVVTIVSIDELYM